MVQNYVDLWNYYTVISVGISIIPIVFFNEVVNNSYKFEHYSNITI